MANILNCVGGHAIKIFKGAEFDPAVRKYRGGELAVEIPFSGIMLSAKGSASDTDPIKVGEVEIPCKTKMTWETVDELPEVEDEDAMFVVSQMYVSACRDLGRDTSRLLTIADSVVNDEGQVMGCRGFNRA